MKRESKELLLKYLCAILPYGVICEFYDGKRTIVKEMGIGGLHDFMFGNMEAKPYLRPMSSMTEEELKELNEKFRNIAYFFIQEPPYYHGLQAQHPDIGSVEIGEFSEVYDWLNARHFDYRNLIEKELAIDCTELNIY